MLRGWLSGQKQVFCAASTASLRRLKRPSAPYLGTLDDQRSKNASKPVFCQGKIGDRFG